MHKPDLKRDTLRETNLQTMIEHSMFSKLKSSSLFTKSERAHADAAARDDVNVRRQIQTSYWPHTWCLDNCPSLSNGCHRSVPRSMASHRTSHLPLPLNTSPPVQNKSVDTRFFAIPAIASWWSEKCIAVIVVLSPEYHIDMTGKADTENSSIVRLAVYVVSLLIPVGLLPGIMTVSLGYRISITWLSCKCDRKSGHGELVGRSTNKG